MNMLRNFSHAYVVVASNILYIEHDIETEDTHKKKQYTKRYKRSCVSRSWLSLPHRNVYYFCLQICWQNQLLSGARTVMLGQRGNRNADISGKINVQPNSSFEESACSIYKNSISFNFNFINQCANSLKCRTIFSIGLKIFRRILTTKQQTN